MSEVKMVMKFTMPFSAEKLFNFVILPESMPLYSGFLLVPGIKSVHSSDSVRKIGTIDKVKNTDGSTHESITKILTPGRHYSLFLGNIMLSGFKKNLAAPITGFKEDWILTPQNNSCQVERSLVIEYQKGLMNTLLVKYFIYPQLYFSFQKHHQNIISTLSN